MPRPGAKPTRQPISGMDFPLRFGTIHGHDKRAWRDWDFLAISTGVCFTSVKKKNCSAGEGCGVGVGASTTRNPMLPSFRCVARRYAGAIGGAHEKGAVAGIISPGFDFRKSRPPPRTTAKISMQRTGGIDLRGGGIGAVPIGDPFRRAFAHYYAPRVRLALSGWCVAGEKRSLRACALDVFPF